MSQTDVGKIGFTVHDDWTPTAYEKLSLVRHNGATWVSKVGASASDEPSPSSAIWKIVAADSSTSGENVSFSPSGNISATNVSSAIRELDAEKSPTVHTHTAASIIGSLGYTPVQQGTGIGQLNNAVKIGWSETGLKATVDATDLGPIKFKHDSPVDVTDPNFDTIPPGTYHAVLTTQGSSPYPNSGILEVFTIGGEYNRVQRYTTWNELVFVRTMLDGIWQPWREVPTVGTGTGTRKAIFGYGHTSSVVSMTNLVSNTGVVSADTTGVGTARYDLAAAGYGTDKAIFGYGYTGFLASMTNLVSNTGVVSADTTGVGTARAYLAAASYGLDKAIFGYGHTSSVVSMTNLVSNTGVVSADTTGVGTARAYLAAASYGIDKAIFGYGNNGSNLSMTNLVSNTGVVSADTTGVGTARYSLAAAGYSQS